jgi:hypothetical protein
MNIDWPFGSGSGPVILNYGSRSLLLNQRFKKMSEKSSIFIQWHLMIYSTGTSYLTKYFFSINTKIRSAGSGSVIQDYRSVDPDPKEIFLRIHNTVFWNCTNSFDFFIQLDILATGIGLVRTTTWLPVPVHFLKPIFERYKVGPGKEWFCVNFY